MITKFKLFENRETDRILDKMIDSGKDIKSLTDEDFAILKDPDKKMSKIIEDDLFKFTIKSQVNINNELKLYGDLNFKLSKNNNFRGHMENKVFNNICIIIDLISNLVIIDFDEIWEYAVSLDIEYELDSFLEYIYDILDENDDL